MADDQPRGIPQFRSSSSYRTFQQQIDAMSRLGVSMSKVSASFSASVEKMYDPLANAQAALARLQARGWGQSWHAGARPGGRRSSSTAMTEQELAALILGLDRRIARLRIAASPELFTIEVTLFDANGEKLDIMDELVPKIRDRIPVGTLLR